MQPPTVPLLLHSCMRCCRNMLTGCCLATIISSGSTILTLSRHITIHCCPLFHIFIKVLEWIHRVTYPSGQWPVIHIGSCRSLHPHNTCPLTMASQLNNMQTAEVYEMMDVARFYMYTNSFLCNRLCFSNCGICWSVARRRWREKIVSLSLNYFQLATTAIKNHSGYFTFCYGNNKYQGNVMHTKTWSNKCR